MSPKFQYDLGCCSFIQSLLNTYYVAVSILGFGGKIELMGQFRQSRMRIE
jgi:hypothetical protein